ncbi:MAG TPA: metallophosphoesterase [Gemmatimonadaceae bacterium]|nr:metallophosphoesterase [Gemmatimonadaceae bacterium]
MARNGEVVRLAAIADIHYSRTSQGVLQPLFAQIAASADVLAICGDLTDYGLPEEARALAKELTAVVKIPIVAVLGNHDYESGQVDDVKQIFIDAGVIVLDGDSREVCGVGFAGIKGFAGGFGRGALGPWGEPAIKSFVHEAIAEALKLETALARLRSGQRIALLHYAPVRDTVEGEPLEIYPYLGSSRLEEPLSRYSVTAVFHGHAHKGCPVGKTATGIPVYNVSLALLRNSFPDRPSFRLLDIHVEPQEDEERVPAVGGTPEEVVTPSPEWKRRATD